jgi:hypothetical protein
MHSHMGMDATHTSTCDFDCYMPDYFSRTGMLAGVLNTAVLHFASYNLWPGWQWQVGTSQVICGTQVAVRT